MQFFWYVFHLYMTHTLNLLLWDVLVCESRSQEKVARVGYEEDPQCCVRQLSQRRVVVSSVKKRFSGRNGKSNGEEGSSNFRVSWFKVCNLITICP